MKGREQPVAFIDRRLHGEGRWDWLCRADAIRFGKRNGIAHRVSEERAFFRIEDMRKRGEVFFSHGAAALCAGRNAW